MLTYSLCILSIFPTYNKSSVLLRFFHVETVKVWVNIAQYISLQQKNIQYPTRYILRYSSVFSVVPVVRKQKQTYAHTLAFESTDSIVHRMFILTCLWERQLSQNVPADADFLHNKAIVFTGSTEGHVYIKTLHIDTLTFKRPNFFHAILLSYYYFFHSLISRSFPLLLSCISPVFPTFICITLKQEIRFKFLFSSFENRPALRVRTRKL